MPKFASLSCKVNYKLDIFIEEKNYLRETECRESLVKRLVAYVILSSETSK